MMRWHCVFTKPKKMMIFAARILRSFPIGARKKNADIGDDKLDWMK